MLDRRRLGWCSPWPTSRPVNVYPTLCRTGAKLTGQARFSECLQLTIRFDWGHGVQLVLAPQSFRPPPATQPLCDRADTDRHRCSVPAENFSPGEFRGSWGVCVWNGVGTAVCNWGKGTVKRDLHVEGSSSIRSKEE